MRKMKFLSTILLAVMTMSTMVACSSSSDDEDGGGVSYTESEIVELLSGTWKVSGDLKVVEKETGKVLEGNYDGNITFTSSQKVIFGSTSNCTRNDFDTQDYSDNNRFMNHKVNSQYILCSTYRDYEIVKKNGKIHLDLSPYHKYFFEIVSLNKNTFKLVLNQDCDDGTHVYMTVISN